jgi:hypothetical protein
MADNQKAKHGDSQSGQKNDQEKNKGPKRQPGERTEEGNHDSTFAQGGEGDQKQEDRLRESDRS